MARASRYLSGHQPKDLLAANYDVGGVLLPRPFKIIKIGPVRLFVDDVDARRGLLYRRPLGLVRTEEVVYRGHRCVFLRCNTEHHCWRSIRRRCARSSGLRRIRAACASASSSATTQQLRDAVDFLKAHGATIIDLPPELFPGIDYSAFAVDPDGHCIQLYYYMEQVGWDGRVRAGRQRRRVHGPWPEALEPLSDTYVDQVFQGPLG